MGIYDKLFPPKIITMANGKTVEKRGSRAPLAVAVLVGAHNPFRKSYRL